jgi:hypothetical protein
MADPVTMAMGGAAAGALLDKEEPLRGAMLGGIGGYIGGPAFGAAAETPGAIAAVTPGLTAGGEQAAMLAAQNAGLGMEGLMATGAAGGNAMLGGMGALNSAMNDPMAKLGMNMMMSDKGQGQGQQMPQMPIAPPAMRPQFQPGTFSSLAPQFNPIIGGLPFNKNVSPMSRFG